MNNIIHINAGSVATTDAPVNETLKSGGGGGNSGDMEARIARLETHIERSQVDLTELRADARDARDRLVRLEERVSHLPSKGFIVSVVIGGSAVLAAAPKLLAYISALPGN